jgi:hypothetical protein
MIPFHTIEPFAFLPDIARMSTAGITAFCKIYGTDEAMMLDFVPTLLHIRTVFETDIYFIHFPMTITSI